jgi:hypothetical protein
MKVCRTEARQCSTARAMAGAPGGCELIDLHSDRVPRVRYGPCDVEIGSDPAPDIRGNIARVVFYRLERYGFRVSPEEMAMYPAWSAADPVDAEELDLAQRTAAVQWESESVCGGGP